MPRMNGVEATRRLKTRWPDLPVIVLTVHDDPVYERTARAAGADRFLLKKTAGTALWPALVSLVPSPARPSPCRARSPGPQIRPGESVGPRIGKVPTGDSGIHLLGGRACSRYSSQQSEGDGHGREGPSDRRRAGGM
jgi:hypothetical protein